MIKYRSTELSSCLNNFLKSQTKNYVNWAETVIETFQLHKNLSLDLIYVIEYYFEFSPKIIIGNKFCFRKQHWLSFRKLCNSGDSYHSLNYVLRIVRLIHWVPVCTSSQTRYGEASSLDRQAVICFNQSPCSKTKINVHSRFFLSELPS